MVKTNCKPPSKSTIFITYFITPGILITHWFCQVYYSTLRVRRLQQIKGESTPSDETVTPPYSQIHCCPQMREIASHRVPPLYLQPISTSNLPSLSLEARAASKKTLLVWLLSSPLLNILFFLPCKLWQYTSFVRDDVASLLAERICDFGQV